MELKKIYYFFLQLESLRSLLFYNIQSWEFEGGATHLFDQWQIWLCLKHVIFEILFSATKIYSSHVGLDYETFTNYANS